MTEAHLPFLLDPSDAREAARLVDAGLLVRLVFDVVAPVGAPSDPALRAAALRLCVPERILDAGAVVAQQAAAWVWSAGDPPPHVDVVLPPGRSRARADHVVLHERRMPPDDVTHVAARGGASLAVTTPTRTAADLLRTLPDPDALTQTVRLASLTSVTASRIGECLGAMPRARGVARARRLLQRWPGQAAPERGTA